MSINRPRTINMKLKLSLIAAVIAVSSSAGAMDWKEYNGAPKNEPTTLPNGSVYNIHSVKQIATLMRSRAEAEHTQIAENVYLMQWDFYAPLVFVREEGLILVNSGESGQDGKKYREYIRKHISDKPILAILNDHNHYHHGAETLLDGDKAMIVARPNSNKLESTKSGGGLAENVISEMEPHVTARARIQFGNDLDYENNPTDRQASATELVLGHKSAWLPATHTLEDGETITIGGLEIQGFHGITDAEDSMDFYFPEYDLVADNTVWPSTNMYTLRGDKFRDPTTWLAAVRNIINIDPAIIISIGGGGDAIIGKEKVREYTTAYYDQMAFIYDQSIRLTNLGYGPHEIRHMVDVPDALKKNDNVNEFYGQYDSFFAAFPVANHGWFSGNPEDLHDLPKAEKAQYTIRLAGGIDNVTKQWNEAMDNGEYLWAKELAVTLYYNDPASKDAREALAKTFRKLGQASEGLIIRNFYLAGAQSLEGNEQPSLSGVQSKEWVKENLSTTVDYLRTRINPELAGKSNAFVAFNIDGKVVGALDIRNSIAEFVAAEDIAAHSRKIDTTIKTSADNFSKYWVGEIAPSELTKEKIINVFDTYKHKPLYPTSL